MYVFVGIYSIDIINHRNPFKFIFISLFTNHYLKIEILSSDHCGSIQRIPVFIARRALILMVSQGHVLDMNPSLPILC